LQAKAAAAAGLLFGGRGIVENSSYRVWRDSVRIGLRLASESSSSRFAVWRTRNCKTSWRRNGGEAKNARREVGIGDQKGSRAFEACEEEAYKKSSCVVVVVVVFIVFLKPSRKVQRSEDASLGQMGVRNQRTQQKV